VPLTDGETNKQLYDNREIDPTMFEPFGEGIPRVVALLWVALVAIALVGWAFLGWERGAGFEAQPVSFVLGVIGSLLAIGVGVWRQTGE
jgi:hypothetical protein